MAERKCGCEVGWRLPEGELIYYRWEIVALETNIARIYAVVVEVVKRRVIRRVMD